MQRSHLLQSNRGSRQFFYVRDLEVPWVASAWGSYISSEYTSSPKMYKPSWHDPPIICWGNISLTICTMYHTMNKSEFLSSNLQQGQKFCLVVLGSCASWPIWNQDFGSLHKARAQPHVVFCPLIVVKGSFQHDLPSQPSPKFQSRYF